MMDRLLFKFYKSYFDVGNELEDKDRLLFYDALLKKQFLGIEPSLTGIAKLAYISQKHSIDAQVKGWEDKTKTSLKSDPTTGGSIGGVAGGSEPPCIQLEVKEEEEVKEKVKEKYITFNFKNSLIDFGFEENLVKDFLIVRKNKKATNSETAFNSFIKQIQKTIDEFNIDKNELLEFVISKDWKSFQHDWFVAKKNEFKNNLTNQNNGTEEPKIGRQTISVIQANSNPAKWFGNDYLERNL